MAAGWLWGFRRRRRRRRTGAQAALRGFFSPAATRWQTQETEPERLSLLSSTSENKCLLETDSRMRLHFHKRHKKSALEHPKWRACVIVCALAQRANGAPLLTSFSSLSVPLAPSSATVYISCFLGFSLRFRPFRPRPGCRDWKVPGNTGSSLVSESGCQASSPALQCVAGGGIFVEYRAALRAPA